MVANVVTHQVIVILMADYIQTIIHTHYQKVAEVAPNQINELPVHIAPPVVVVVGLPNDRPATEPGVIAKYTYHYFA